MRMPITVDTNQACTVLQMAHAIGEIAKPAPEDVPLSVDPDDYPLF